MEHSFDLVVIGTGAGGSAPANRCRAAGWRVAVVDELPYGGTCALRGCDPKKVMVGAADLIDWGRRMQGSGATGELRLDWASLMQFKRTFTGPVPADREAGFQRAGIVTYHGHAQFAGPDCLAVGPDMLRSRYFLIATGARPRPLGIRGEANVRTSTEFLELDRLPARVAFIGAGYISFEFAHIVQRAGAQPFLLGRTPLKHFDQDLVRRLIEHTRELGIEVHLGMTITAVEPNGGRFRVHAESGISQSTVEADMVVHGAGRIPNTEGLHLEEAEVALRDAGGVSVNEFLQSLTNPRVYATGDVAPGSGSLPLTPVAAYEGGVVASNLLKGNSRTPDYRGIPSVIFTSPPLARVGLSEHEAREQHLDIQVRTEDVSGWFSSRRVHQRCAMFKTIVDKGSDQIVGAHLLGPHAEEVINIAALAIRTGLTATDVRQQIYAYPTSGSELPYML